MANPAALKTPITVEEIQQEELYGVVGRALNEAAPIDAVAIWRKLRAAEDFYERDLGIRFKPTRVFSDPEGRKITTFGNNILALPGDYSRVKDLAEPAYDKMSFQWRDNRWGFIRLRHSPVATVTKFVFAYPGVNATFDVPLHWIRRDDQFGTLHIVPGDGEAILATFHAFFMSYIAGARSIPMSIFIDYVTGWSPDEAENEEILLTHHADLLEGLRLRTVLEMGGIFATIRSGGVSGGSLGLDGLSRSRTFAGKYGPYSPMIELALEREKEIREKYKDHEKGVPMEFA